jgi:hypothetical protein
VIKRVFWVEISRITNEDASKSSATRESQRVSLTCMGYVESRRNGNNSVIAEIISFPGMAKVQSTAFVELVVFSMRRHLEK